MFKSIPLNKLVYSKKNVRKHSDPAADAELKADIKARGLLQNLVVRSIARGKFEVDAGGRRLKALKALAKEKAIKKTEPIICLVKNGEDNEILEISLSENFQRAPLNPADEAEAFQSIIDAGSDVEGVAKRYGKTVRFVEGRLRLAALAPAVFEALASGEITLDLAKAYGALVGLWRFIGIGLKHHSSKYISPKPVVREITPHTACAHIGATKPCSAVCHCFSIRRPIFDPAMRLPNMMTSEPIVMTRGFSIGPYHLYFCLCQMCPTIIAVRPVRLMMQ